MYWRLSVLYEQKICGKQWRKENEHHLSYIYIGFAITFTLMFFQVIFDNHSSLCIGKDSETSHVSPSKIGEQVKNNKVDRFSIVIFLEV